MSKRKKLTVIVKPSENGVGLLKFILKNITVINQCGFSVAVVKIKNGDAAAVKKLTAEGISRLPALLVAGTKRKFLGVDTIKKKIAELVDEADINPAAPGFSHGQRPASFAATGNTMVDKYYESMQMFQPGKDGKMVGISDSAESDIGGEPAADLDKRANEMMRLRTQQQPGNNRPFEMPKSTISMDTLREPEDNVAGDDDNALDTWMQQAARG